MNKMPLLAATFLASGSALAEEPAERPDKHFGVVVGAGAHELTLYRSSDLGDLEAERVTCMNAVFGVRGDVPNPLDLGLEASFLGGRSICDSPHFPGIATPTFVTPELQGDFALCGGGPNGIRICESIYTGFRFLPGNLSNEPIVPIIGSTVRLGLGPCSASVSISYDFLNNGDTSFITLGGRLEYHFL